MKTRLYPATPMLYVESFSGTPYPASSEFMSDMGCRVLSVSVYATTKPQAKRTRSLNGLSRLSSVELYSVGLYSAGL